MAELPVVSDAEFRTAMQVFALPINKTFEGNGREVVLYTKTANGKAIRQPLSLFYNLTDDLKEVKRSAQLVLVDTIENCTADEIVVDQMCYVRKRSKANTVFMMVNNSGMDQVFQEYLKTMKNGHNGAPYMPGRGLALLWCVLLLYLQDFSQFVLFFSTLSFVKIISDSHFIICCLYRVWNTNPLFPKSPN